MTNKPSSKMFPAINFGERQFDTCVEMGDAEDVKEGLREIAHKYQHPKLLAAFDYMGWSLERKQKALF